MYLPTTNCTISICQYHGCFAVCHYFVKVLAIYRPIWILLINMKSKLKIHRINSRNYALIMRLIRGRQHWFRKMLKNIKKNMVIMNLLREVKFCREICYFSLKQVFIKISWNHSNYFQVYRSMLLDCLKVIFNLQAIL